jgi:hypothetical protein
MIFISVFVMYWKSKIIFVGKLTRSETDIDLNTDADTQKCCSIRVLGTKEVGNFILENTQKRSQTQVLLYTCA